ncbi:tyrosine-protein phosphatase [Erythrobacteraceae bacterium CFH 75059]|uniref:tyrosine-protein phosphatase n=1 Tax=Qipengyuania thermophila TaxID=2509361 RepID=UPI0010226FC4|nr:tyrosine-protein phosphatase [Qipengyuania thermophila]TCD02238.1 tyrosine-protein phosphatase [Erythrobacteraceae bacterium CFH 75059]
MNALARFLPFDGVHNFRDYGGWPAGAHGHVRRGLLYRSGQHVGASDADLSRLDALSIRTVIDLRGNAERERHPCRRPPAWRGAVVFFDGETSNAPPHLAAAAAGMSEAQAVDRMIALYRRIPHNPAMHAVLGDFLRAAAACDGASLVHCFAGKDRTGIAVTLLLHILGVSEDDQRAEFLLTNAAPTMGVLRSQSLRALEQRHGPLPPAAVEALLGVRGDYLDAFRDEVRAGAGSLDDLIARPLGVSDADRRRLRERLLA